MIDDGTQAGGGGVGGAMRLSLVTATSKAGGGFGGDGVGVVGVGSNANANAYNEMVETASIYANAADGLDNLGYVNDAVAVADNRHRHRELVNEQLLQQAHAAGNGKRTVRPVIHFPKPPPVAAVPTSPTSSQHSQQSAGRYATRKC